MKILVTGSSGRIGRYVVQDLAQAGHKVTGVDVVSPAVDEGSFLQVDLTQAGQVYQAVARAEAEVVVHLGAWANAGKVPDTRTYGDNVRGTFNLFQACADLGVRRVISASSAQVYGFAGGPPRYIPVDEAHPLRPLNSYALSKVVGEQAATYFGQNFGLMILSFRFMGIRTPATLDEEIEQMAVDPASGQSLLWTRTDTRDAALACRLALEAETVESGPYNITGTVVLAAESQTLAVAHFGEATEIRANLSGQTSPLSCARAERVFGYRPRYLWSEAMRHPE